MLEISAYKHTHTYTGGGVGGPAVRHIILSALVSRHSPCQTAPVWIVPSVMDTDAPCAPLGRFFLAASRCFVRIASHNIALTNSSEQTLKKPRQPSAPSLLRPCPKVCLSFRSFSDSVQNHCQNLSVIKKTKKRNTCLLPRGLPRPSPSEDPAHLLADIRLVLLALNMCCILSQLLAGWWTLH